jgi:hypothetical protein
MTGVKALILPTLGAIRQKTSNGKRFAGVRLGVRFSTETRDEFGHHQSADIVPRALFGALPISRPAIVDDRSEQSPRRSELLACSNGEIKALSWSNLLF